MAKRNFSEVLHGGYAQVFTMEGAPLVEERSDYQRILVFDSVVNGRVLVLDDIVQLTDRDEASYSEMLAHLPILEHGAVRRVLIVGGGDGAVAEEVLKHAGVEQVDLVDIDPKVVEISRRHFAHVNKGAFDESRLSFYPRDAFAFLKEAAHEGYDLVIADRPDPVGPAESLFGDTFYDLVRRVLHPGGLAVFQTGCPFFQPEELSKTWHQLGRSFDERGLYLTVTPTYTGGFMALTWAGRGGRLGVLDIGEIERRFQAAAIKTDYYTPAIHTAAFGLPAWIARLVS